MNERHRPTAAEVNSQQFEAMIRLHGKAVTTAGEVLTLLGAGYSTGALARARTLHEVATVALLLAEHDEDLARRYLAHEVVESLKAEEELQEYHERLGYEPPDSTVEERQQIRDDLVAEFGSDFLSDYGWAAPLVKDKPTFTKLEQRATLDHWRPHYRMASQGVHANPKGVMWNVQLLTDRSMVVAGPSNAGLTEAAQMAGIALFQVNVALLNSVSNLYDREGDTSQVVSITWMYALELLLQRAVDAFVAIHRAQEAEEDALEELSRRILIYLVGSPNSTVAQIAAAIDADADQVADALARYETFGLVVGPQRWLPTVAGVEEAQGGEDRKSEAKSAGLSNSPPNK